MNTYRLYYYKVTDGPRQPDILLGVFNANEEKHPNNAAEFQKIVDFAQSRIGYLKSEEFHTKVYDNLLKKLYDDIEYYKGIQNRTTMPRPPYPTTDPSKKLIYAHAIPLNTFLMDGKVDSFPIHYVCGINHVDCIPKQTYEDIFYLLRHT